MKKNSPFSPFFQQTLMGTGLIKGEFKGEFLAKGEK